MYVIKNACKLTKQRRSNNFSHKGICETEKNPTTHGVSRVVSGSA